MSGAVLAVRISDPLLSEASLQAARAGVSIEEWLLALAAERVRDEQVSERFFSRSNPESAGKTMLEILDSANDGLPLRGDEVPGICLPETSRQFAPEATPSELLQIRAYL